MNIMAENYGETRVYTFKCEEGFIDIVDDVAKDMGLGKRPRSSFIRMALKEKLARMSYLSPEEKKALGVVITE